jgi:hypothetical protein
MLDIFQPLTTLAEHLISARFARPLRLNPTAQLDSQHIVLRCQTITEDGDDLPRTVILKQLNEESRAKANFSPRQLFLNEWASLEFLSVLPADCGPGLYASHHDEQFVILEDLGDCPSLQDILYGQDSAKAQSALAEWGTLLGSLHSAASGHEAQFLEIQISLGAATSVSDGSIDLCSLLPQLHECLQTLAVTAPTGFDSALSAIQDAMHGPSPFRTMAHFDAGPHNVLLTLNGLKLIDYELAGFGNGLIDLTGARMAFPAAYRGRRVPRAGVEAVETNYRTYLADTVPLAAEDKVFQSAILEACAYHAFVKLWGFWKNYLKNRLKTGSGYETQRGIKPENAAYFRQMVFTYLLSFVETAETFGELPDLRIIAEQVMDALRHEWPELEPWTVFPAFQSR